MQGSYDKNENSVILFNKQNKPVATRALSPITKELKIKKFSKLKNFSNFSSAIHIFTNKESDFKSDVSTNSTK
jgi:hypothetical protein